MKYAVILIAVLAFISCESSPKTSEQAEDTTIDSSLLSLQEIHPNSYDFCKSAPVEWERAFSTNWEYRPSTGAYNNRKYDHWFFGDWIEVGGREFEGDWQSPRKFVSGDYTITVGCSAITVRYKGKRLRVFTVE